MKSRCVVALAFSACAAAALAAWAGSDPGRVPRPTGLAPLSGWAKIAPGIWRAKAGDTSREMRYTDLAAAPPRLDALRARPERDFPFAPGSVEFERTVDGKTVIRVPCAAGEKLYGFGLQFDGLDKSLDVLTLDVDHWSTGGGRTHAPVQLYVSSR